MGYDISPKVHESYKYYEVGHGINSHKYNLIKILS